jgi:hypothetical protein
MGEVEGEKPLVGDLAGAGQLINSKVAQWTYKDGLSPSVKQVGALTTDALKAFRLFTAPLQLAAAYQDRFEKFCDRVRERVPEAAQCDAPPEIARPVMEAFASTSDGSPMMSMFEELMAKAIDKGEAKKLSPQFPEIVKLLSPLQAVLVVSLKRGDQFTDDLMDRKQNTIKARIGANFNFDDFGGPDHHLTLVQDLDQKKLVTSLNQEVPAGQYPNLQIPEGLTLCRTVFRLTMFGHWFAAAVTPKSQATYTVGRK